jgi:WD40 repeat protein
MEPTLLVSAAADGLWFWNVADCRFVMLSILHFWMHYKPNVLTVCGRSALKMISKENESDFHDGEVTAVSFAYGGQVLFTGGRDCSVKVWDVANKYSYIDTLFAHRGAPTCIAFCRGSRFLATAGLDCSIRLWDCSQLDSEPSARRSAAADSVARVLLQGSLEGHRGDVTALTWSSTGLVLFSGGRDAQIIIWDAIALSRIRIISGHKGEIRRIVLLNKEKLLMSASRDCSIKLWELGAIENKETSSGSLSLADIFKPDSGASDSEFTKIGSEAPDKLVSTLPAHSTELERCEVNPRFPLMATSSGGSCIRLWRIEDVSQPSLLQEIAGHCKPITSVRMFHNGRHALLGAQDHCVSVVEVQTMRRLATMPSQGSVKTVCISANETTAFIGSTDYVISAYSLVKESSLCFKQFASTPVCFFIDAFNRITPPGRFCGSLWQNSCPCCIWRQCGEFACASIRRRSIPGLTVLHFAACIKCKRLDYSHLEARY